MSVLPIRVRLMLVFALAMTCVIGAMAVLVYVRVGGALLTSVDQTLRAQATEALLPTRCASTRAAKASTGQPDF